jgi:hypothetical protein
MRGTLLTSAHAPAATAEEDGPAWSERKHALRVVVEAAAEQAHHASPVGVVCARRARAREVAERIGCACVRVCVAGVCAVAHRTHAQG